MLKRYWDPAAECAPVPELVATLEARLGATDVFVRAAKSALYRGRWQTAGIDPTGIRSYADLRRVPFTSAADLRRVQADSHPDELVCSEAKEDRPRYWCSTSGSTGVPKWIPMGGRDLDVARRLNQRLGYFVTYEPNDVIFAVSALAPAFTDTGHFSGLINELRDDGPPDVQQIESVVFSFQNGAEGVDMALKRHMTVFIAFPSLVMRIAEGIRESAPATAAAALRQKLSLGNVFAYLFTRTGRVRARHVARVHTGLFSGEPLQPYRKALYEHWGLKKSHDIYSFTECPVQYCECDSHSGIHMWLDESVPEIIRQPDLEREREEAGYVPPAYPLWTAEPGTEGELVLTNFAYTFPLVRWRTGDLLRVVSTEPCTCGRTTPRVALLQRSDDLVNLGIIRLSTFAIKEKLDQITRPAAIAAWQLRVSRKGYKPLLKVLVRPAGSQGTGDMAAAVRAALAEIHMLREGYKNGLICEPEVSIVPDLGERIVSSGKLRPLVYEEEANQ